MKRIKTSELIGPALDWAVSVALHDFAHEGRAYSTSWAQGGPIIEREGINLIRDSDDYAVDERGFATLQRIPVWVAEHTPGGQQVMSLYDLDGRCAWWFEEKGAIYGPTALVAAMRCYVASKLGAEIEVPDELV